MNNQELVVKEALASADLTAGGYLNPMQSEKFLRGVIDQPTILRECRTVFIDGESKLIEKVGFGQRIMRPGSENTPLRDEDRSKPQFGKVQLTTKEAIAEVRISYDTLENNIEGAGLKNTIISLIQQRVALDLEELAFQADTDSDDPYLALVDGFLKKAKAHVVDASGNPVSTKLWKKTIGSVPAKYRRVVPQWRIYTSHDVDLDWKETIAARNTVAGDRFLLQNTNASALGYEVQPCAMIPVTDQKTSTALLTHPKNLIAGFTRKVQIETDKDITARQIIIVVTVKVDFAIEEVDACAKLINIGVDSADPVPPAPDLGDLGVYYYEMTDAFTDNDTVDIYGTTYTKAATADAATKVFGGATIKDQVTSLASMVSYGGFAVSADNDRLIFTQLAPITGFRPTLVEVGKDNTTGDFGDLTVVVEGRSPGDELEPPSGG